MPMPQTVKTGQTWSIWVPGRRQWLLATVTECVGGQVTLKYHAGYKIGAKLDELRADESTMLTAKNLFRLLEDV